MKLEISVTIRETKPHNIIISTFISHVFHSPGAFIMSTERKRRIDIETVLDQCKRQRYSLEENEVFSHERTKDLLNELRHGDPVLALSLAGKDSPDIIPTSKNLLKTLLFPLSPFDFKSNCFRKKAVHIRSNRNDRGHDIISKYMFGLDPKQIFEETSSDNIFLWIPSKGEKENSCLNTNEQNCLQSIAIQDPNTAHILHTNSKYASYCRAPPELEQILVSSMLRETGFGLGQYDPMGKSQKLPNFGSFDITLFLLGSIFATF